MKRNNRNLLLNYVSANRVMPVCVLMVVSIFIGLLVLFHYGESWDEHLLKEYSEYSLRAYTGGQVFQGDEAIPGSSFIKYYGPSFLMLY